ncbi:MAG: Ig-like domain-containing protein [Nocardioides sp.]
MTVSDGRTTGTEKLVVLVRPPVNLPPVANADFVRVEKGDEIVVNPLRNDTDPNGDAVFLLDTDTPPAGAQLTQGNDGTFQFSSKTPGTLYLGYRVGDGPAAADGVIRIEVIDPKGSSEKPVTDKDLALLPDNGTVTVDVLANDTDPQGGVLVVQSATATPQSGVSAQVIDHDIVRINEIANLEGPTQVEYRVANKAGESSGVITVVPLKPKEIQPPIARDDDAVVRSGDIVSVKVLENDESPSGRPPHPRSRPSGLLGPGTGDGVRL